MERERTNKSARALRRDIVSCKVNHLRGSKTASSPCRNLLSSPRGDVCYLVHAVSARYFLLRHRHFCLSSSRPPRPPHRLRYQRVFLVVSPVSVNMRTHSLVISVIGSLHEQSLTRRPEPRDAGSIARCWTFQNFPPTRCFFRDVTQMRLRERECHG